MVLNETKLNQEILAEARKNAANNYADGPETMIALYNFFKELVYAVDDLQDELDDMDDQIVMQHIIEDDEHDFKWWVKVGEGIYDTGVGEIDEDEMTVSLSASWEITKGLIKGSVDPTTAYMTGDIIINGNLQHSILYGGFAALITAEIIAWRRAHPGEI